MAEIAQEFVLNTEDILRLVEMSMQPGRKTTCFLEGLDDGQSTDKKHSGQIELTAFMQTHGVQGMTGFSSGLKEGSVSRVTEAPVICAAVINNASAKIALNAATGATISKDIVVHFATTDEGGAKDYATVTMVKPNLISHSTIVDTGRGKALHIFAIASAGLKWKHDKEAGYNFMENSKI